MTYKYSDTVILVFCKAPIAGQVKTRLMPQLSAEQAVDVHIKLTQRLLSLLFNAQLCQVQLWCSPDTEHPFFSQCAHKYALSLHEQQGHDLGERMHHAISIALESASRVLLVGCDCPSLIIDDFEFAIDNLLSANDIVFAPAEDGGYVMIGMTNRHPTVFFNMTWGNDDVLNTSRQRAIQAGLTVVETKQQWDVDTFDDLKRFYGIRPIK